MAAAPSSRSSLFPRRFSPLRWFKKEPVLTVSALCMALSMAAVPPSLAYLSYIDFRVLALLFCLMAVVAGLQRHGLFPFLARRVLAGKKGLRTLVLILIFLPFFFSMLVTNDVALITFVPFAILVLTLTGQRRYLIFVVVMQTVAANLGSMATPVGNPQNLYLYSAFSLSAGDFFSTVLPFVGLSIPLLGATALLCPQKALSVALPEGEETLDFRRAAMYLFLFALCLLSVFHVLSAGVLFLIVAAALLLTDRQVFRDLDYSLLLTFVCFFVFAGNIGAIEGVRTVLRRLLADYPLLATAAASQVISNVPAAVLLSGFTEDWRALLLGADIGGLGTPIASLASLISMRLYMKTEGAKVGKYLAVFMAVNAAGLLIFLLAQALFSAVG